MDELIETSPVEELDAEQVVDETPVEETESTEPAEGEVQEGEVETDPKPVVSDEPSIKGNTLSDAAKQSLEEIRAKNPKLAAELKGALFANEALKQVFPGGVKEVQQFKAQLDEVGGFDGIKTLQGDVKYWDDIDAKFTNADPAFVEMMATEAPDAFAKLAPQYFQKFAEVSPDGYAAYISQTIVADAVSAQIPLTMARLEDAINAGDAAKAHQLWNGVADYFNKLDKLSKGKVAPVAAKAQANAPSVDDDRAKFQQEKEEFTRNQWVSEASKIHRTVFDGEFARLTKNLKLTDVQKAHVEETYRSKFDSLVMNDPEYKKTAGTYFKNGDQASYKKYVESYNKQKSGKVLEGILSVLNPGKRPGPKVTPITQGRVTPAVPGSVKVAKPPSAQEINWGKTNTPMYKSRQAVLNDGRKVSW